MSWNGECKSQMGSFISYLSCANHSRTFHRRYEIKLDSTIEGDIGAIMGFNISKKSYEFTLPTWDSLSWNGLRMNRGNLTFSWTLKP